MPEPLRNDITTRLREATRTGAVTWQVRMALMIEAADEIDRLRGETLEVRTTWQFDDVQDARHSFLPAYSLPVKPGTQVALVMRS